MSNKILKFGLSDILSGIPDAKSFIVDVDISESIKFHVELFWPIPCENCMSMSIDKSRESNQFWTVFDLFKLNFFFMNPLFDIFGGRNTRN